MGNISRYLLFPVILLICLTCALFLFRGEITSSPYSTLTKRLIPETLSRQRSNDNMGSAQVVLPPRQSCSFKPELLQIDSLKNAVFRFEGQIVKFNNGTAQIIWAEDTLP